MMDIEGQKDREGAVMIVDKEAPVGRKRYVGHPKMSSIGSHIASSSVNFWEHSVNFWEHSVNFWEHSVNIRGQSVNFREDC
jgi:hypothetical protein